MKTLDYSLLRSVPGFRYVALIFLFVSRIEAGENFIQDPNDGVLWNATYFIDVNESISQARLYHLRMPLSLPLNDSSLLMPLVIQLHGGGGNASNFEKTTRLGEAATARGYIVVYGEGIDNEPPNGVRGWNAGRRAPLIQVASEAPLHCFYMSFAH